MNKETYCLLENFMLSCMNDTAHDKEHIYRVLYNALEIAKTEHNVNYDVLIASCLLHDIGRKEQLENPALCHAVAGSEKAYQFLFTHGFELCYAEQVKQCIQTHRYRKNNPPQSLRPVDKVANLAKIWYNKKKGGKNNAAKVPYGNNRGFGAGESFAAEGGSSTGPVLRS